jgi:hypothetical protein
VYRPVHALGSLTTYQQHKSVLLEEGCSECPRLNILNELRKEIEKWLIAGYQVIVAGDFNDDIRGHTIKQFFFNLSMEEIILKQNGSKAPNTYVNGSVLIDGIFATTGINPVVSGYTEFSWGIYSDHRLLWVDLSLIQILGSKTPPLWKPKARRLKCDNPIIVRKFNNSRLKHFDNNQIHYKMQEIKELIAAGASMTEWGRKVEALDKLRVEGILIADKECRKLKMGKVPWSPELGKLMARIDYLQRCRLKYVLKRKINSRTLQKYFKKTDLDKPVSDKEQTITALKNEFTIYFEL